MLRVALSFVLRRRFTCHYTPHHAHYAFALPATYTLPPTTPLLPTRWVPQHPDGLSIVAASVDLMDWFVSSPGRRRHRNVEDVRGHARTTTARTAPRAHFTHAFIPLPHTRILHATRRHAPTALRGTALSSRGFSYSFSRHMVLRSRRRVVTTPYKRCAYTPKRTRVLPGHTNRHLALILPAFLPYYCRSISVLPTRSTLHIQHTFLVPNTPGAFTNALTRHSATATPVALQHTNMQAIVRGYYFARHALPMTATDCSSPTNSPPHCCLRLASSPPPCHLTTNTSFP